MSVMRQFFEVLKMLLDESGVRCVEARVYRVIPCLSSISGLYDVYRVATSNA